MKYLLVLLFALLTACAPVRSPEQVNLVTVVTDASIEAGYQLARGYEAEAVEAIAKAQSQEEAVAALNEVDERWEPVWRAWGTLRDQHDACLIGPETCNEQELSFAWCDLELRAARVGIKVRRIIECI